MSPKQHKIREALKLKPRITLEEATFLVGMNVYHNQQKHTGALLSNMVKRGLIVREKPGVFALPTKQELPENWFGA